MAYQPYAESDYTDSDSEFDFAFPKSTTPREIPVRSARDVFLDALETALRDDDVETVRQSLVNEEFALGVNETLPRSNWTALLHAAHAGSLACVQLLVEEKEADVSVDFESMTPILLACDALSSDHEAVRKIVELLLARGASAQASDRYGITPLMYACRRGNVALAEMLLSRCDPEAIDSNGRTALFHAIEEGRRDAVALLLRHGVCKDVVDFKGFTPKRLAEYCGHAEIAELIPRGPGTIDIPTSFLSYSRMEDVVPSLGNSDVPAYFPDLKTVLFGMDCEQLLPLFALKRVSLEQFLAADDAALTAWGVRLPYLRKKLLHGLFLFHQRQWAKQSVPRFDKHEKIDMLDVFRIAASNLKHLVVLQATCAHIRNAMAMQLQPPAEQKVASCRYALQQLIEATASLKDRVSYVQSFNPRPILHIDHEAVRRKRVSDSRWRYALISLAAVISVLAVQRVRQ
ncbi:ankyrin repeat, SAM and basic leucine zipper domain-containing protein 1 [Phlebotomus argentipes]|uniref:ankyrin repeat, SAM and basic leucine zipper domain-containing protein 1 n=1 Tax=Phlebotomus argentipes TaxID=94469 RepID=UPI0028930B4C|nr:ankyrin repeat, SAM and basic leucine zipper domain-containing protein 1 [Phlebotomus argentipes]